jgi:hypothetical protein
MKYDSVIVGSSPLMLLEAIYRSIAGENVLIIEKQNVLGGAWFLTDFYEHSAVESGGHIWYRDQYTYKFLREILHLGMVPFSPQPEVMYKNKKYSYKLKPLLDLKTFLKNKNNSFISKLRKIKKIGEDSSVISQFYYPKTGSVELMEKLISLVEKMNISVLKNTSVINVKINQDVVRLETNRKEVFLSSELVVSSHGELNTVHLDGKKHLSENNKENTNHTMHLELNNNSARLFSYLHLLDNKNLIRVADLSFQMKKESKGSLICVQITDELFHSINESKEKANIIVAELIKLKLLAPGTKVLRHKTINYTCRYRTYDEMKSMESQFGDRITFLNTINFSYSIRRQLERWEKLDKAGALKKLCI